MSPEQLHDKVDYDYKVDIFSMGLVLFEMLWTMPTSQEKTLLLKEVRDMKFPEAFMRDHPEEHSLLQEMLHHDPKKRPTCRGIRARNPLRRMELPHELEKITPDEHYNLTREPSKHRRTNSSVSNPDQLKRQLDNSNEGVQPAA